MDDQWHCLSIRLDFGKVRKIETVWFKNYAFSMFIGGIVLVAYYMCAPFLLTDGKESVYDNFGYSHPIAVDLLSNLRGHHPLLHQQENGKELSDGDLNLFPH